MNQTPPRHPRGSDRAKSDEEYLRRVLDRAGVPHRKGLRGIVRYTYLIAIPAGLATPRPAKPCRQKNRLAAITVGVLSTLGAALALMWNQIILSITFCAIGVTNLGTINSRSNPSNASELQRH